MIGCVFLTLNDKLLVIGAGDWSRGVSSMVQGQRSCAESAFTLLLLQKYLVSFLFDRWLCNQASNCMMRGFDEDCVTV